MGCSVRIISPMRSMYVTSVSIVRRATISDFRFAGSADCSSAAISRFTWSIISYCAAPSKLLCPATTYHISSPIFVCTSGLSEDTRSTRPITDEYARA